MSLKRISGFILMIALFALFIHQSVKAAIDLVSFTATAQEDSILIEWETATEIDNAGFYVTRSTDIPPPYEDVSGFIYAEGSGVIGEEYQFIDDDVTSGTTYYYILEAVDLAQNVDYHGPISVTLGIQNTPTPTSTPSKTSTPNKTSTPTLSPTPTKTRTPVPGNTATPTTPTITPTPFTETPTATETPSITPSPTLLDAPEIVMVLPATNSPVPMVWTAVPLPSQTPTPKGAVAQMIEAGTLATISAICLVILVWAAIAIAVFIYIQKRIPSS